MRSHLCVGLTSFVALGSMAGAQTPTFTALADFPAGSSAGRAWCVSPEGTVVVGTGNNGNDVAALWRQNAGVWSGPLGLGVLAGGTSAAARACSISGGAVFGDATNSAGFRQAVRWSPLLPVLPSLLGAPPAGGYSGSVNACSADGMVACGDTVFAPPSPGGPPPLPITQAFRWTTAGMVDLGTIPGVTPASGMVVSAKGISNDGSVVVGSAHDATFTNRPWRWTQADGMVDLSNGTWVGVARGCSPDGQVVVGSRTNNGLSEAFAWTSSLGRVDLGTLTLGSVTHDSSAALDASHGMRRVCGVNLISTIPNSQVASLWEPGRGWRAVHDVLANAGIDMTGWRLTFAQSISDDGTVVAGAGVNPQGQAQAWVAFIPLPCVADVDDGTGSGTPDGGVTIDDLLYYLVIFEEGNVRADVDDGTGTGTPDGGVTIDDLLYYLTRFESGC